MSDTSERNRFKNFSGSYYKKLLRSTPQKFSKLFLVEDIDEHKVLAAGIWIFFGKTCTYLFGASSNENRNKMPTFFMHYKAMEYAKNHGYWFYDFYGIDTLGAKKGWEGITRFKRSFGGQEVTFLNSFVTEID
jgi:lipid II:glycine glycyltransferase (peptidoglycan interpeptide bridge formation enzyme)